MTGVRAAIEAAGLVKTFGGTRALDGVGLFVPEGSVFGFLGPNGAGKTTTLRILMGLARPTSGTARVLGRDATRGAAPGREVGFLPDIPGFYPWMTARELMTLSGRLFGLEGQALTERVGVLLEMAGLAGVGTRIGGFSRGMKQRLGIAQALVNAPRLLLLDEPTSALDPIGRREVLEMIASLRGRTTVFFSSHILADIERVCDRVAILDRGRVVAQSGVEELAARTGGPMVELEVGGDGAPLEAALMAMPWVREVDREAGMLRVRVTDLETAQIGIPRAVAAAGLPLRRMVAARLTLEDAFVALVGGGAA